MRTRFFSAGALALAVLGFWGAAVAVRVAIARGALPGFGAPSPEDGELERLARAPGDDRSFGPYLYVKGGDPETERLPLEATKGDVEVVGTIAHVTIQQTFVNRGERPIEAVYVFPASTRAAVHHMRMRIGARLIEAKIERKAKARAEYEAAKQEGRRAALLEQERANVFSTSVANVMPGDRIDVTLEYSEMLVPHEGVYELVYPSVVGPRYTGGADPKRDAWMSTAHLPAGTPEPYAWDVRAHLETGVPLAELASPSHDVRITRGSSSSADVALARAGGGDRDFVLRYRLAGARIETGLLLSPPVETAPGEAPEGFFALLVEPPRESVPADLPPREYVFVLDVSGSMHGFPLDTAKSVMRGLFAGLRPTDSFNVVLFSGAFAVMSDGGSVAATPDNVRAALALIDREQGGGGTELVGALEAAYKIPHDAAGRSRTVVLVTDGYIGTEAQAFQMVREHLGEANLFAFGIGSSVNRALIEGVARAGYGEPFVVLDAAKADAEAIRFRKLIERPLLTNVKVAFEGFDGREVAPGQVPDLMGERPLVVFGKYRGRAAGKIVVTGTTGQGAFRRVIDVGGAAPRAEHAALRWLWARKHAEELDDDLDLAGVPSDGGDPRLEALAQLGLRYSLLTRVTSFVAIDRIVANTSGSPERVDQPLALPHGVSNLAVGTAEVSVSRSAMPPGDPILTVLAPKDARLVTAHFPFGLVKDLAWDEVGERWVTRFLVPKDVPDGAYDVPVVVVHADGHCELVMGHYRIDSGEPDFEVSATAAQGSVTVEVLTREKARLVQVALVTDPRQRTELRDRGDGVRFVGRLALAPGRHRLRVVVADEARNEASHELTVEVR